MLVTQLSTNSLVRRTKHESGNEIDPCGLSLVIEFSQVNSVNLAWMLSVTCYS